MFVKKLVAASVALPLSIAPVAANAAAPSLQAAAVGRTQSLNGAESEELRGSPIIMVILLAVVGGALIVLTSNGDPQSN